MARLTRTAGQGKRGVLLFGVLLGFGLAMVFNSVVSAYGGGSQVPVVAAQAQQSSQQPAAQQQQEVQPAKEEEKPEQQQPPEHKAQDEKPLCTFLSAAGGGAAPEPVPTPARSNLFKVLQQEGLKIGAELGVQAGLFAEHALREWPACTEYYLVDIWAQQENYDDMANVNNEQQNEFFTQTKQRMEPFKDKAKFLRMTTTQAAEKVPDDSLDYVYVDARHDYCGVQEDLRNWWPKLRRGGIFAGHDYLTADSPAVVDSKQDWSLCMDGTRNRGAVKGAVDEFAAAHNLTLTVTCEEMWPSWIARKP